jgi:Protein of unknown function (DUF5818)
MKKAYLITAILLLSAVWVVAQTGSSSSPSSTGPQSSSGYPQSSSPSSTSPSSNSPSSQTGDKSSSTTTTQTTTSSSSSDNNNQTIEGCLAGSAGSFTLADPSGTTYQLAGDTSKLSDHVGHQVRLTGSSAGGTMGSSSSPGGVGSSSGVGASGSTGAGSSSSQTFTVKKVKMIASSCSNTSK